MHVIARSRALVLALSAVTSLSLVPLVVAQETDQEASSQEVQSLVEVIEAALEGELVPTERPFGWENAFLKSEDGTTYVLFTLVIDPVKITSPAMVMYLYVMERPETPVQAANGEQQEPEEAEQARSSAFEDSYVIDVDQSEQVEHRVSRAFSVPAGEYDVYVAVKETNRSDETGEPARVMMLKEQVTVPDLWSDQLATSSIILAERVEPLPAPPSPEEQRADPYTLGTTRIVPAPDSTFAKDEELSLVFLVYNAELTADNKPDVTVEYSFHQRTTEGEEYFNRTNPQNFNAQTLPPSFDLEAGHQLVAGLAIPLSLFPEGDYRLEITVTDNAGDASMTRDVTFSVSGP
jgi:hypothetical protein